MGLGLQSGRDVASNNVLHDYTNTDTGVLPGLICLLLDRCVLTRIRFDLVMCLSGVMANTVPVNLTVGFNFSSGKRGYAQPDGVIIPDYVRCPVNPFYNNPESPENDGKNPACYCLTRRCKSEDEEGGSLLNNDWTATSMVTFYQDDATFNMGVTPNTQHRAPRIFAPTVLYLPLFQPMKMGTNFSFRAFEGADEDGMTVLEWSSDPTSVLKMKSDGSMTMLALAFDSDQNENVWPAGWQDWYKWFSWKIRINAVDRATAMPVTSTMTMLAKLCTSQREQYVPIAADDSGVSVKALGQSQTVYVKDFGPTCMDADRNRLTNIPNHSQAECAKIFGAIWAGDRFYAKAESQKECHIDEPCQFEVHAVRLDFVTAGVTSCKWSDAAVSGNEKYCHELTLSDTTVVHDAFHVSYTGEHEHGENFGSNPGKMLIKPFRGRSTYKNPYSFDIGRREVFCLTSTSNDTGTGACPSLPHCVTVLVKGRAPVVTSPVASDTCTHRTRPDASEYLKGECPDLYTCWRSETSSEITLSAEDEDIGETVTIVVDSISTYTRYADELHHITEIAYPKILGTQDDGVDVNDHCRGRAKDPNENPPIRYIPVDSMSFSDGGGGTPPLATVPSWGGHHCGSVIRKVTFDNKRLEIGASALETKVTPLGHRYVSMKNDSVICYTVSDNQAEVWGRGVNNKYSRCHVLRMRGAPVFQYSSRSPLDTPFRGPDQYGIGLAETTLTARLSEMVSFTFRARDPNPEDAISVMFLEDPGIPNEAVSRLPVSTYIPRPWTCLHACCSPSGIAS